MPGDEIRDVAEDDGIPFATELAFIAVFGLYRGLRLLRRYQLRLMKDRYNSRSDVPERDDGGVRLSTDGVEYYLKWQG
jgi:hypothetical protein